ncbi:MAG: efflux RND transporter periplasmic adaptor subunit [Bacteroidaceae bacterium]|nr:efflux RND transporter periplasmic adaptor subunit [Bacteroidaceae bacterium]
MMKTMILKASTLLAFTFLVALAGCESKQATSESHKEHEEETEGVVFLDKNQRDAINLQMGTLQKRNMSSIIKCTGELEVAPNDQAHVTAYVGGNVKSIQVFEGDRVKKGQILAQLEHPDIITLQQEYINAYNSWKYMQKEFARQKELFDNNVGSGKNFQRVEADYQSALSTYEGLKLSLKMLGLNTKLIEKGIIQQSLAVLSPISGYVSKINISLGSYIDARSEMFSIINNDKMHADLEVYEQDIARVKVGQTVLLKVANRNGEELKATIFAIAREFKKENKTVQVHAQISPMPTDLITGSYVEAYIQVGDTEMLAIPQTAIVSDGGKEYLFVYDPLATKKIKNASHQEGEAHEHEEGDEEQHKEGLRAYKMVEIITGIQNDGYSQVTLVDSLSTDAQIVITGAYYLLSDLQKSEAAHSH